MKTKARAALPAPLQQAIRDRVVIVSMGRRSAQKQQDVLVESMRAILRRDPGLPIFTIFATTGGAPGAAARLQTIKDLQTEFPLNVFSTDGLIDFYADLMMAADLNVMPSLWEPHGSAFEGMVIPVARAVDGLLGQISPCHPIGQASLLSSSLHAGHAPNGFLFREEQLADEQQLQADFEALLRESPSPHNATFNGMVNALTSVLLAAVDVARADSATYVALVGAALTRQAAWSWNENFAMQVALMRDARNRRIDLPAMA